MPSILFRFLLFISSYAPLFAILALLAWDKNHPRIAEGFGALTVIGVIALCLYLSYIRRRVQSEQLSVQHIESKDSEILSYIVTYFFPFMADFSKTPVELVALLLLFVVIAFIHVNSNMIHINPLLNLLGYHLFEVEAVDGKSYKLLTDQKIHNGSKINVAVIGDRVFLNTK